MFSHFPFSHAAIAAALLIFGPMIHPASARDASEMILDALSSVSAEGIDADARVLTGIDDYRGELIDSREIDNPHHQMAVDYLVLRIEEIGFETTLESFDHASHPCANLIVELPGRTHPENIRILGAHYDSDNDSDDPLPAPGAVDNASGVLAVLQTLTALKNYSFSDTIRFVLFDAEEWGLIGSRHHAQGARSRGENIVVMLNLDIPGWRVPGINRAFANSDFPSWPFLERMNDIPNRYPCGTKLLGVPAPIIDSSNMAPFWDEGFAGLMVGSLYALTPWMNTRYDTYEKLDVEQTANVSRIMTAYLAEESGILGPSEGDDADDSSAADDTTGGDDTTGAPPDTSGSDGGAEESGGCGC